MGIKVKEGELGSRRGVYICKRISCIRHEKITDQQASATAYLDLLRINIRLVASSFFVFSLLKVVEYIFSRIILILHIDIEYRLYNSTYTFRKKKKQRKMVSSTVTALLTLALVGQGAMASLLQPRYLQSSSWSSIVIQETHILTLPSTENLSQLLPVPPKA